MELEYFEYVIENIPQYTKPNNCEEALELYKTLLEIAATDNI